MDPNNNNNNHHSLHQQQPLKAPLLLDDQDDTQQVELGVPAGGGGGAAAVIHHQQQHQQPQSWSGGGSVFTAETAVPLRQQSSAAPPPPMMTSAIMAGSSSYPPTGQQQQQSRVNDGHGGADDDDEQQQAVFQSWNESYATFSPFQWTLLAASCFYSGGLRLLVHLQVFQSHYHHHLHPHFVFWSDLTRLLACLALEAMEQKGDLLTSLHVNNVQHVLDALKPAVPALLVWLQGHALFQALTSLPLVVAESSMYAQLLGVAAFGCISPRILGYRYTLPQWSCMGVAVLATLWAVSDGVSGLMKMFQPDHIQWATGVFWWIVSFVAVSLSAVCLEYILKQDLRSVRSEPPPATLWMRGAQFSLVSGIAHGLQGLWTVHVSVGFAGDNDEEQNTGIDWISWIYMPTMAANTLLMMAILKYVTAVHERMTFLLSHAIVVVLSLWFFGIQATQSLWVLYASTLLVVGAAYLFGWPPPEWVRTCLDRLLLPQQLPPQRQQPQGGGQMIPPAHHFPPRAQYEPLAVTTTTT